MIPGLFRESCKGDSHSMSNVIDSVLKNDPARPDQPSSVRGWLIVMAIALSFFVWGLLVFYTVGVRWPPPWRYGTVPDVPGQSVYGVGGAEKEAATAPPEGPKVRRQHVMGAEREEKREKGTGGS
jgi:hypothetical protein